MKRDQESEEGSGKFGESNRPQHRILAVLLGAIYAFCIIMLFEIVYSSKV